MLLTRGSVLILLEEIHTAFERSEDGGFGGLAPREGAPDNEWDYWGTSPPDPPVLASLEVSKRYT